MQRTTSGSLTISHIGSASASVKGRSTVLSPVRTGFSEKFTRRTVPHAAVGHETVFGVGYRLGRLPGRDATQARTVSAYQ
ncbi:hypothetical protein GCM10020256_49850 [Streptomyces thermocoprophilus]